MIYLRLFLAFFEIGLFSLGGGYAALPLIQSRIVEQNGWLTLSEFTDLITIAEMTPGPMAINSATFVGNRIAGFGGALAASFGCIVPSLIIVSVLFLLYARFRTMPFLQNVLKTLRPIVVALIASAGLTLLKTAVFRADAGTWMGIDFVSAVLFAAAFFVLRKWKLNPILVMAVCGALYLGVRLLPI